MAMIKPVKPVMGTPVKDAPMYGRPVKPAPAGAVMPPKGPAGGMVSIQPVKPGVDPAAAKKKALAAYMGGRK